MMTTIELYVIPYLWMLTVIAIVVVAVGKGIPIMHVFGLYHSKWSFWIGIAVLVFAGWCMLLEYLEGRPWRFHHDLFGQEPRHTAKLVTLIFVWVMLVVRVLPRKEA